MFNTSTATQFGLLASLSQQLATLVLRLASLVRIATYLGGRVWAQKPLYLLGWLWILLLLSSSLQAQSIDPTFPTDLGFNPGTGSNNAVLSVVVQGDGKILMGGQFTNYNEVGRNRIARLNADGSLDTSFNPGTGANAAVQSIALQGDGKVLIGGDFTTYNGIGRNGIARLNTDGSLDTDFNPGSGASHSVYSVTLQVDGKILIGGDFTGYNGVGRNGIARLNPNGSLDTDFNPGSGVNGGSVYSVALQGDGKILIGGFFTSYNEVGRNRIARINTDGSLDTGFNPGTGADDIVLSVARQGDGKILIGGIFTSYNGTPCNYLTRLNTNGSLDTEFDLETGVLGGVTSLAVQGDDKILMGGGFPRITRLNPDGSPDTGFNPGTGADGAVFTIAVQGDGKILIGGDFGSYNGTERTRIARLNVNGSLHIASVPGSGANGIVNSASVQGDGKILIGGSFTNYNGTPRNNIARLNADGSLDTGFNPGTGANGLVYSIVIQGNGKILIGGSFTNYNGTGRNRIARLNTDGSLDMSFNPGTGASSNVNSVVVQGDGKILIGGVFTSYNGIGRNYIARLNADGSLDMGFNPGTGANNYVYSIAVQGDGKILIGGNFTSYNGTGRNRIARLNTDGSLDTDFNQGVGGSGSSVNSIVIQGNDKILIGGIFTSYNGTPRNNIARLNANGSIDLGFDPGTGAGNAVQSIVVQGDGKILIGGVFATYNGTGRNNIARLNADGNIDTDFDPGTGANGLVFSVAVQGDGKILIGGSFTSYNGTGRNRIARLLRTPVTLTGLSASPSALCPGRPVSVSATLANLTDPYTYTLTNGTTTINGSASSATFSQTMTASGSGSQQFTLRVDTGTQSLTAITTLEVYAMPVVSLSASGPLTCTATSVTLTASASGSGLSYSFSAGTSTLGETGQAMVSREGTYSVTVTSGNGCTATGSAQVIEDISAPILSLSPSSGTPSGTTLTCASPTVSLSAVGSGAYRWSTGATTSVISVSTANTYSVTLTGANGCSSTAIASVSADQTPPSLSLNSSIGTPAGTTLTCTNPVVSLSAVGSGTYHWNTGATTSSISVSVANTYYVTLTGANGCSSTATINVSQDQTPPSVSINPSSATLSCTTSSVSLSVVGTGTYRWSTGATTSSISVSVATTYSVTLTGANGCTATASASVTYQNCAPTVANAIPPKSATIGDAFSYIIPANTFTDAETPNSLTLSVTGLPAGLSFISPNTITGVPSTTVGSPFNLTVTATDPGGLSVRTTFGLTVNPRSFAITRVSMLDCNHLSYFERRINFVVNFEATNGQPISLSVVNEVPAITIPEPYQLNLFTDNPVIVFKARQQGTPGEATFTYNWLAHCANGNPRVDNLIPPQSATVGQAFSYTIPANTFTDAETPNSLSLSVVGLPAGLSFVAPATIVGWVSASASSFYSVTVTARDSGGGSVSTLWPLSVVNTGDCASMYSVKGGDWSDASVWSCGRVPVLTDVVTLNHGVNLPASYQGDALRLIYSTGGRLVLGASSRLRLGGN